MHRAPPTSTRTDTPVPVKHFVRSAGGVDEAGRTADQDSAVEGEPRHGLPAALVARARAVADAAAVLQDRADRRMLLPALKLFEGVEVRVLVAERDDEPQGDLVALLMIEEATAPGVREGPTLGVDDAARGMFGGIDVPQLLQADSIDLRLAILTKLEDALQFLGEMAAGALGEEGVFAVQLHAGLVIGLVGAIAGDAHVAGGDALHRAIVVEQYLEIGRAHV